MISFTDSPTLSVFTKSEDVLASPHETITPEGFESLNDDASHLTQEETVKGEEPVGRDDVIGVDKYDPLVRTSAVLGKDVEFV
jgi:hypothetical protein